MDRDNDSRLCVDDLIFWPELHRLVGYCRMHIDRLEKAGKFPRRIKLGMGKGGRVAWRRAEVMAWLDSRPRGPNGAVPTAPPPLSPPSPSTAKVQLEVENHVKL